MVDPAATFLLREMAEDIAERLAFMRHEPGNRLIDAIGLHAVGPIDASGSGSVTGLGPRDLDTVPDLQPASFDCVASIGRLDAVNDLPGALIQMRELLRPGGVAMAAFGGGASLPALRQAMMAADGDRPAPRIHPLIDPRSCPGLLGRAAWRNPVVDSYRLTVRYRSLAQLVADLRTQGLSNSLSDPGPPLSRAAYRLANEAFAALADADGKTAETFEIVTLTGSR